MTKKQIKWAMQHDWFLATDKGGVWVRHDTIKNCAIFFNDFKALYNWAY